MLDMSPNNCECSSDHTFPSLQPQQIYLIRWNTADGDKLGALEGHVTETK